MRHLKLNCLQEIPHDWKVGNKIIMGKASFRIISIEDSNNITVRKWCWFDYLAIVIYAFQLLGEAIIKDLGLGAKK